MFHLHRLEHHQPLACGDAVALGHIDRDDLARHGGDDRAVARCQRSAAACDQIELVRLPVGEYDHAFVVGEDGQRFEWCGLGRVDRGELAALPQRHLPEAITDLGLGDLRVADFIKPTSWPTIDAIPSCANAAFVEFASAQYRHLNPDWSFFAAVSRTLVGGLAATTGNLPLELSAYRSSRNPQKMTTRNLYGRIF